MWKNGIGNAIGQASWRQREGRPHHAGAAGAHVEHVLVAARHDELVLAEVRQQAQQPVGARPSTLRPRPLGALGHPSHVMSACPPQSSQVDIQSFAITQRRQVSSEHGSSAYMQAVNLAL